MNEGRMDRQLDEREMEKDHIDFFAVFCVIHTSCTFTRSAQL